MSNRTRKQDAHRARRQRHENKRAQKRESARSHHKEMPRSQRRSSVLQFPAQWGGLFQSTKRQHKAHVLTGEKAS